ncbi:MAG: valine--tRNA ligase [Bacillota bacterium]
MLSKKYNHTESEKKWQNYWKEIEIYKYDSTDIKEVYSIDTPPPTVNGNLHIGHIFSYTQAEMIARYQRMQGKNVFYPFGFDDNGLPTERLVEKEKSIRAKDLPRSAFTELCLDTTAKYEEEFKELWQSLGFSVDWSLQYETINPVSQRISQKSFLDLVEKGKAYIKETPVLWCTNCQTSIAQAELEWLDKETSFNYINFESDNNSITVATTRPELLYGCTAIFVHPEDERYKTLIGKNAVVPLYGYEVNILGDERVSMDKGTGAVMCCTFGDSTDMDWYNDYKLPYRKVIEGNGLIYDEVPYIAKMSVYDARTKIIELLNEKGLIIKSERLAHSVSIHERCGCETEIIPSRQWYIDVLGIKEQLLEAGDKINWYPETMKIRYQNWVSNLKWDWCISRQRYFGVPFPVWYCSHCGHIILADEEMLPVNPLEEKPSRVCECGSYDFMPEEAVFDTWATSSVTPLINAKWKEAENRMDQLYPMSMRTQAHEIIRTWAFYTIVKSLYHTGQIPWRDIMVCGFVMAKKGEKISKSKSNSSNTPKELILEHSADAIRYWAANARLGTDIMFSEEDLLGSKRFLTKLWNASKFAIMHLADYDNKKPQKLMASDKWIISGFNQTMTKAKGYLDRYEIGAARQAIDDFFWNDFCDNYLELVKDRLYKPEVHGAEERTSGQHALYKVLLGILKLYSIYVPHITEEIYQAYFAEKENLLSIHTSQWDEGSETDIKLQRFGYMLDEILKEVRKYKSENNLSLRAELKKLILTIPDEAVGLMKDALLDIKICTASESIEIIKGKEFKLVLVN